MNLKTMLTESFKQLFLTNLRQVYRNSTALFFNLAMPAGLYIALSVLPIPKINELDVAYSNYILSGIVAYTVMTAGIYGLAYWLTDLKAKGVVKRFLVTPIKTSELVISLITARIFLVIIQAGLLTALGVIFFKANFAWNITSSLLIIILGGAIFLLIGLLISNFSSSYEAAAPLTSVVGLTFTFFGNIFYPADSLPDLLKTFANFLPISHFANALRQSYLYSFDFSKISGDLLTLLAWFIILLAVTIKIFKLKE